MFVDVSAKAGLNLDKLLEAVVLTADASLDLRANPTQDAQGLVVEAHLDRGRGPVATVLVQRGTLRVGDSIVAGPAYGRVRAMLDEHGENIDRGRPVASGDGAGPHGGARCGSDNFIVVEDDRMARQIAEKREARERAAMQAKRRVRRTLEDFMASMEKGESQELNLILKGDVSGSVEALEDALSQIDVGDEVSLRVIDRGVGAITETNVDLAAASDAIIIGFNVRPQGKASEMADKRGCRDPVLLGHLPGDRGDRGGAQGHAQARSTRSRPSVRRRSARSSARPRPATSRAAWSPAGRSAATPRCGSCATARWWPTTSTSSSLRREKDDASEVREGFECGLGAPELPGHQDRRHRRGVRDARDRRAADHRAGTSCPSRHRPGTSSRASARRCRSARPGARKCPVTE